MKRFFECVAFCVFFLATPAVAEKARKSRILLSPFFTVEVMKKGGLPKEELASVLEGKGFFFPPPLRVPKETVVGHIGKIMADKFGYGPADGFSPADVAKIIRASDVVPCSWRKGQVTVYGADRADKKILHGFSRAPYPGEQCLSYKGAQFLSLRCGNTIDDKRVRHIDATEDEKSSALGVPPKPKLGDGETAFAKAPAAGPEGRGAVIERTVTLIREPMRFTTVPVEEPRGFLERIGARNVDVYVSASVCAGGPCPFYGGFGGWWGWPVGFGGFGSWNQVYTYGPETPPGNTSLPLGGNGSGWGNMVFPSGGGLDVITR